MWPVDAQPPRIYPQLKTDASTRMHLIRLADERCTCICGKIKVVQSDLQPFNQSSDPQLVIKRGFLRLSVSFPGIIRI